MRRFWLHATLSGLVLLVSIFNLPVMIDQVDLAIKPISRESVDSGQVEGVSDSKSEQPSPTSLKPSQPSPSPSPLNESLVPSPSTKSKALIAATELEQAEVNEPTPIETKPTFNISQAKLTNHHPDHLTLSWQDELVKAEVYQVRFSAAPITVQNWEQAELVEVVFPADEQSLMLDQEHFLLLRRPDLEQGCLGISLIDGAKYVFGLDQKLTF